MATQLTVDVKSTNIFNKCQEKGESGLLFKGNPVFTGETVKFVTQEFVVFNYLVELKRHFVKFLKENYEKQ